MDPFDPHDTIAALALLDASGRAYTMGDLETSDAHMAQALREYPDVVAGLQLGMTLGEIPTPDMDDWYVWYGMALSDLHEEAEILREAQAVRPTDG